MTDENFNGIAGALADAISTTQVAACDYRVIDFGTHYAIHEVYYDEDGKPVAYAACSAEMTADAEDGWAGIVGVVELVADAVERDALDVSVFAKGDA